MPIVNRVLTKSGISIANDVFQPSEAQKQHIQTNYIATGKLVNTQKSVAGNAPGSFDKVILSQEFVDADAFQEYINDPVIQGLKADADAFYASRSVAVERNANFEFGDNPNQL